jgi:hypothetical protein
MFSYFGVLISVILGLALTHLVRGLSKLVQMRDTVKIYWVHVVWTFNIIIYVLCLWWGMYWWNNLNEWTFELFGFLAAYSTLVFVVASLLYPAEFAHDMDFEAYYYKNQRWFFGLLFVSYAIDIPETYWKSVAHLRDVPTPYVVFLPTLLVIVGTAALSRSRKVQASLCVISLILQLAYVNLSALQRIVAH